MHLHRSFSIQLFRVAFFAAILCTCMQTAQAQLPDTTFQKELNHYLSSNFNYRRFDVLDIPLGTFVGGFECKPGSSPNIFVINSMDPSMNEDFNRVIQSMILEYEIRQMDSLIFHVEFKSEEFNFKVFLDNKPVNVMPPIIFIVRSNRYNYHNNGKLSRLDPLTGQIDLDSINLDKVRQLFEKGKYKKCIVHLDPMINRNPYFSEFYYMRAVSHMKLGQSLEALKDLSRLRDFMKCHDYDEAIKKLTGS